MFSVYADLSRQLSAFLYFFDDPCGVSRHNGIGGDVVRDDASRADGALAAADVNGAVYLFPLCKEFLYYLFGEICYLPRTASKGVIAAPLHN